MPAPDVIETEAQLDDLLTQPSERLAQFAATIEGPLLVLGAGGKMGPSLAALAKRANPALEVIAVSRFNNPNARAWLDDRGIKTIPCDLLDESAVKSLPDGPNVIHMVGQKFGTSSDPAPTWAMNTIVPARVAERFHGARIVALSTGNVYPNTPVEFGGALESAALTPLGEYPNSAVGRERVFQFYSARNKTRVAILRLFYAVDLRYGVVVDIAQRLWRNEPIPLGNGAFNCIWQGDANEMVLRSLALTATPARVFNLCLPQIFSVRETALELGRLMDRQPVFAEPERSTSLLGNAQKLAHELGAPATPMETIIRWVAHWTKIGGLNINKRTHFEVTDGAY
jgi:nucleoside-diphosphate-sugar epimerase